MSLTCRALSASSRTEAAEAPAASEVVDMEECAEAVGSRKRKLSAVQQSARLALGPYCKSVENVYSR